jgi:hypothetical protein
MSRWGNIKRFMNSSFAGWFFPVVVIAIFYQIYQQNKNQSTEEIALKKEINLRIKLAKDASNICYNFIVKNNDSGSYDLENKLRYYLESSISNVLQPNPTYYGIDSVDYDGNLRNNSLYNLCSRFSSISNKNSNRMKSIQKTLDSLKGYLKYHRYMDSSSFYDYYIILNNNLEYLK